MPQFKLYPESSPAQSEFLDCPDERSAAQYFHERRVIRGQVHPCVEERIVVESADGTKARFDVVICSVVATSVAVRD